MRHSPDAGLNLPHRSRTKSALACGEPRSPPRVATLSHYYALSEVGPTPHSTHVAFGVRPTDLTLSCAAGPVCRNRSGAAAAANDVRRTESRPHAPRRRRGGGGGAGVGAGGPGRGRRRGGRRGAGDERGGAAAGPKRGRTSFSVKLAAA